MGAYTKLVDGVNVYLIFRRDLTMIATKAPMLLVAPVTLALMSTRGGALADGKG